MADKFVVEHETFGRLEIELAKLNAPDKNECVIWTGAKVTNTVRNYSFAVDITNLNCLKSSNSDVYQMVDTVISDWLRHGHAQEKHWIVNAVSDFLDEIQWGVSPARAEAAKVYGIKTSTLIVLQGDLRCIPNNPHMLHRCSLGKIPSK